MTAQHMPSSQEEYAKMIRVLLGCMPPALQKKWPNAINKANILVKSIEEGSQKHCLWIADYDYESDIWETSCGNSFIFEDEGPKENGFEFCPYCGMPIKTGAE